MRFLHGKKRGHCRREIKMKVYAIRGAITADANTEEEIAAKSIALVKRIKEKNSFDYVVSIMISSTSDLTASYPAKAIRESGALPAPLFSCIEPGIEGALPMCIRVMITVCSSDDAAEAVHVYMGKAAALRREFADE